MHMGKIKKSIYLPFPWERMGRTLVIRCKRPAFRKAKVSAAQTSKVPECHTGLSLYHCDLKLYTTIAGPSLTLLTSVLVNKNKQKNKTQLIID